MSLTAPQRSSLVEASMYLCASTANFGGKRGPANRRRRSFGGARQGYNHSQTILAVNPRRRGLPVNFHPWWGIRRQPPCVAVKRLSRRQGTTAQGRHADAPNNLIQRSAEHATSRFEMMKVAICDLAERRGEPDRCEFNDFHSCSRLHRLQRRSHLANSRR